MKTKETPKVGRADYVVNQKRQVLADRRTRRARTRSEQRRASIREQSR